MRRRGYVTGPAGATVAGPCRAAAQYEVSRPVGKAFVNSLARPGGKLTAFMKGAKVADLPVQSRVRCNLAINLATAKALGLEVPICELARADAVTE